MAKWFSIRNGHIIRKSGIPARAFSRIKEPFRTIFHARSGTEAKLSYAYYIWVTPQKIRSSMLTDADKITSSSLLAIHNIHGVVTRLIYCVVPVFQKLDITWYTLVPESPLRLVYEPCDDATQRLFKDFYEFINIIIFYF